MTSDLTTVMGRRARRARLPVLAAVALVLLAGACAAPSTGGVGTPGSTTTVKPTTTTTSTTTTTTIPATYKNGRCVGTEGVTIVVDFTPFNNGITVRCALGPQTSGFAVLDHAAFAHDPGRYPGTVCQLNGLPTQGHPYCWTTGGYWSYWKSTTAGGPWVYSEWGAGVGPRPAAGSVEGWRFAPFSAGAAVPPRIGTSGPVTP